jgi:hypothetical protein
MILSTFHPREVERFLACCGGYRRWELIEDEGSWWWRLASDWGLAHIADVLIPVQARLVVQLDISQTEAGACPGHGTVSFCGRIRVGRLGIDGLPFQSDQRLGVALQRGRLRLSGSELVEPSVVPLHERYWNAGPVSLRIDRYPSQVRVFINDDEVAQAELVRADPALLLLTANSAGMPEAGTRFGQLSVRRL